MHVPPLVHGFEKHGGTAKHRNVGVSESWLRGGQLSKIPKVPATKVYGT